jgi:type IV secretory pathway VirB10-like protein
MYDRTSRWLVIGLLAVTPYALAQQTPPTPAPSAPTKNVPRPDDLEPGVNTSTTTPSAATPYASGPADTPPPAAPKVSKPAASAKASTSAKATANSSGTAGATATGAPASTPNSRAKSGKAEDRLQLDTTDITGNQELPKVLYIVPWKRSDLGDLLGKPANSLLDEVLEPIDRDVFKRENRYYDALKPDATGGADQGAGAASQGSGDKH